MTIAPAVVMVRTVESDCLTFGRPLYLIRSLFITPARSIRGATIVCLVFVCGGLRRRGWRGGFDPPPPLKFMFSRLALGLRKFYGKLIDTYPCTDLPGAGGGWSGKP
jgi:hypothetical protein